MMTIGAKLDGVYTDLTEGNTPSIGDIFAGRSGKTYKFIQYEAATAAVTGVAGEMTGYYLLDGHKNNIVTSDFSDTLDIGAGVLVAGLGDGEYGWIQIRGPVTMSIAVTAGADGDSMTILGADDGTLDVAADTTAGIPVHICAYAGDVSDKEFILRCDN